MKIRTGDKVIVIAGNDKGETGRVTWVAADSQRVIVEGIRRVKRHTKHRPGVMAAGGIIEKSAPIHVSNVALIDKDRVVIRSDGRPTYFAAPRLSIRRKSSRSS